MSGCHCTIQWKAVLDKSGQDLSIQVEIFIFSSRIFQFKARVKMLPRIRCWYLLPKMITLFTETAIMVASRESQGSKSRKILWR